jgi:translation initiation factor 6
MPPRIERLEIGRSPWLGVYSSVNDEIALLPEEASSYVCRAYERSLGVDVKKTSICATSIIGSLTAMNSKGVIAPDFATSREKKFLGELGLNVGFIEKGPNAAGNLILVNEEKALVGPSVAEEAKKTIADVMGVELTETSIGNMEVLGSIALMSDRGLVVSPKVMSYELDAIKDFLSVRIELGTVNSGSEYVGAGAIANSKGAIAGKPTTGMELGRIEEVLFSCGD